MQAKRAKRLGKPGKPTLPPEAKERVQLVAQRVCDELFDGNRTKMGNAFGVSQPAVTGWIDGSSSPSIDNLERLARFAHIELEELRKGVKKAAAGTTTALDVALLYHPGRWNDRTVARGRTAVDRGEIHTPQGWKKRLDELGGMDEDE